MKTPASTRVTHAGLTLGAQRWTCDTCEVAAGVLRTGGTARAALAALAVCALRCDYHENSCDTTGPARSALPWLSGEQFERVNNDSALQCLNAELHGIGYSYVEDGCPEETEGTMAWVDPSPCNTISAYPSCDESLPDCDRGEHGVKLTGGATERIGAGLAIPFSYSEQGYDLKAIGAVGLRFSARTNGEPSRPLQVLVSDRISLQGRERCAWFLDESASPAAGVGSAKTCPRPAQTQFELTSQWQQFELRFDELVRPESPVGDDAGASPEPLDPKHVFVLYFHVPPAEHFELWLDDLSLLLSKNSPARFERIVYID